MPPKRKQATEKVLVPAVDNLLAQPFRLHCQLRHPGLGFYSHNEHEQDHRMRESFLDHVHADKDEIPSEAAIQQDLDEIGKP
jgi:hypothetical protein